MTAGAGVASVADTVVMVVDEVVVVVAVIVITIKYVNDGLFMDKRLALLKPLNWFR